MKKRSRAVRSDFAKVDATPAEPDQELPEVTDEMLDRSVHSIGDTVLPTPRRGRPAGSGKKDSTTIRLDRDVLAGFRAMGRGWQTRINDALREWLSTHREPSGKRHSAGSG